MGIDPHDSRLEIATRLHRAGRLAEARRAYESLLQSDPENPDLLHRLGVVHLQQGDCAGAERLLRRAITRRPEAAPLHSQLGVVLGLTGRTQDAIGAFQKAIELQPAWAEPHNNLAVALEQSGRLREALANYRRAIERDPAHAAAHNHSGNVLLKLGRVSEAVGAHRRAIALRPDYAEAYTNLASAYSDLGRLAEAIDCYRKAVALRPESASYHSNLIYALCHDPAQGPEAVYRESRRWAQRFAEPLTVAGTPHRRETAPGRRLRVGYLSPDFRQHTIPRLIAPVLANHDRRHFEVFCYASVDRSDNVTDRVRSLADQWRDITRLTDAAAAELIRRDRIDLLVDLAGHMAGGRLLVLARKPAPVQVQLGYTATTGLSAIDYRLTDAYCDPPGLTEAHHSEILVRLPDCAWCYEADADLPSVQPPPAATNGYMTFGSLNRPSKLNERVMRCWGRILERVPGSRLTVLAGAAGERNTYLREQFAKHGIGPERLILLPRMSRAEYLAAFHRIDVALDTFPYSGDTTTCDALWMGVPVVTLAGDSFRSRRGVSLLASIGFERGIAYDLEDYVGRAVQMACDVPGLVSLHQDLRRRMQTSVLADGVRYTRTLEQAFRRMWERWGALSS